MRQVTPRAPERLFRSLARHVVPASIRRRTHNTVFSRPLDYLRAGQTSRAYANHYRECRRQYRADGHDSSPMLASLRVLVLNPADGSSSVVLPMEYDRLVERVRRDLADKLSWSAASAFHPPLAESAERTVDAPGIRNGDVVIQKLKDHLHIDGLEELCLGLIPLLERAIYGCYVLVDKVYVTRTYQSHHRLGGSFIWHYDEHPFEVLKLLIYLTDVDEDSAPFTYLASETGSGVLGAQSPLFGQSRIPEATMRAHLDRGCQARSVVGPAGTAVLFNDNVIHRAMVARRGFRDALFLQLRPSRVRRLPYVDARWTGSMQHVDFNANPDNLQPSLR